MKNFLDIFLIGIALSMDAFAVGICKGLTVKGKSCFKGCLIAGLWFGVFQALMPLIGYFLGSAFSSLIESFDHWIAFGLLVLIGGNMIRESFSEEETVGGGFGVKEMFPLAVATSIDALAVGVSFACIDYSIWEAILIIGLTTFALSFLAVKIGSLFGAKYRNKATLAGGIILVLIGVKVLLEHLGILSF